MQSLIYLRRNIIENIELVMSFSSIKVIISLYCPRIQPHHILVHINFSQTLTLMCENNVTMASKRSICLLVFLLRPCSDLVPVKGSGARALKWTLFTHASAEN